MDKYIQETIKIYNSIADDYAKQAKKHGPGIQRRHFCSLLKKHSNILDVGCGSGRDSAYFVHHGFTTIGVDLSERLLEIAKNTVPQATFMKEDIRNLPFPANTFDGIWSCASLLYVKQDEIVSTLKNWFYILKPKGILFIYVKIGNGEEYREEPSIPGIKRFYSLFTKDSIMDFCKKAGFVILECFDQQKEVNVYNKHKSLPWISCFVQKI